MKNPRCIGPKWAIMPISSRKPPRFGRACRRIIALSMATSGRLDRKSTRLNSSHDQISYAVFCLKKKKNGFEIKSRQPLARRQPVGMLIVTLAAERIEELTGSDDGLEVYCSRMNGTEIVEMSGSH